MDWLTKVIESLKLKPRYVLMAGVFFATILFLPEKVIAGLSLTAFQKDYRAWFALGFLLCASILIVHVGVWCRDIFKNRVRFRIMRRRLHVLTEQEKNILRGYIGGKTITQKLYPMDGVVAQLVAREVIGQSTSMGSLLDGWAYNIQPWAWDYLNKYPHLLDREGGGIGTKDGPKFIDPTFRR